MPTVIRIATATSLVMEALIAADDFVTGSELVEATGCSPNNISAALSSLRGYRAVESMEWKGQLLWMATPKLDTRSRRVDYRKPEVDGRVKRPFRSPKHGGARTLFT